ncbi:hypothetical protein JD844_006878 [Phrynosoma platyrhinos]|uniref:Uncharacterized protein n=1 Tax=Phrynosoma platyrhinos TaxID=52577 RepID=A0ABQ7T2P3_PHRPL|nr:hypothetical protein JD844_006878 [Phrynosoma platyrhinos]
MLKGLKDKAAERLKASERKIPWINIYAQVQHDKEQEMIGSVNQSENVPKISLSEFTDPEELIDKELDTRVIVVFGTFSTPYNNFTVLPVSNSANDEVCGPTDVSAGLSLVFVFLSSSPVKIM